MLSYQEFHVIKVNDVHDLNILRKSTCWSRLDLDGHHLSARWTYSAFGRRTPEEMGQDNVSSVSS